MKFEVTMRSRRLGVGLGTQLHEGVAYINVRSHEALHHYKDDPVLI